MTYEQFIQRVIDDLKAGRSDIQTDNNGQLIVYTGYFKHSGGTIQEQEEASIYDD